MAFDDYRSVLRVIRDVNFVVNGIGEAREREQSGRVAYIELDHRESSFSPHVYSNCFS